MRKSLGTARALRVGLISVALGALIAVGCALPSGGEAAAQNARRGQQLNLFRGSRSDCTRRPDLLADLDTRGSDVTAAARCEALVTSGRREQIAYAQFYTGKANRIQAEESLRNQQFVCPTADSAAARQLQDADRLFSAARGNNPAELSARASLERARVLRLQCRFSEADSALTELRSNEPPALFEQAMVTLSRLADSERRNQGRAETPDATTARRGAQLQALSQLQVFSSDIRAAEYEYVVVRGPMELARLANKIGVAELESQQAQGVDQALARLTTAQLAIAVLQRLQRERNGDFLDRTFGAQVYFNLGRAQLRQAGMSVTPVRDGCQAQASGVTLQTDQAERSFNAASALGARDAYWGLGCISLSRGLYSDAIAKFGRAIPPDANSVLYPSEYYLAIARAHSANSDFAGALQNYAEALQREPTTADREDARARIHIEMADAYRQSGMLEQALQSYREALGALANSPGARDRRRNQEAYYQRGLIFSCRNSPTQGCSRLDIPRDVELARANLAEAGGMEGARQAPANYELSLLEERACGLAYRCTRAVASYEAADRAVRSARSDDPLRDQYRRQACQVRIRFGTTNEQGQAYCTAEEGRGDYVEGLLYEGMFWLAEADRRRGGSQQDAWSNALRAFQRGAEVLANSSQPDRDLENRRLRDLVVYGQRIALYCAGLGATDNSTPPQGVPEFFIREHGVPMCRAAR